MRKVLFGLSLLISTFASAQRACESAAYRQELLQLHPQLLTIEKETEAFLQSARLDLPLSMAGKPAASALIRIPVVVHVLYNAPEQNISDDQVHSQIEALNRDFRRRNADSAQTPGRFKSIAADVSIEFYLATADPKGRPTTGIVRKATQVKAWNADDKIKFSSQGGDDAWDSRAYLNIWVGHTRRLLGYASVVGGPAEKDGLVINYTAFGTKNIGGPYNMGRTAVHEAGHWLGLKHTWGDTYCGDDGVGDTPKQGNFTSGCPTGFRTSCNNGSEGDMYMNYMDFTADACINLFTEGQKERMRALFLPGGPRHAMLASRGLSEPWTPADAPEAIELPKPAFLRLFPNPAMAELTMDFTFDPSWVGQSLQLVSLQGHVLRQVRLTAAQQKLSVADLRPGLYFLQGRNDKKLIRQKFVKM